MKPLETLPPQEWSSSGAGRLFTGASEWKLRIADDQFALKTGNTVVRNSILELVGRRVKPGWFWSTVHIQGPGGQTLSLDGISNGDAENLRFTVEAAIAQVRRNERIAAMLQDFQGTMAPILEWATACNKALNTQLKMRGWITREVLQVQLHVKPVVSHDMLEIPNM